MPSTATDRLSGLTTSVAVKAPCKAYTSTAITQSGEQTIGGVACVDGDRYIRNVSPADVYNGIWVVRTGAHERAKDFDGARDVVNGTMVLLSAGGNEGSAYRVVTENPIYPGTTVIEFEPSYSMTLQADLASTASGKGSKLVAFIQRLTGAVGRWVEDKLAERVSPEDFGAVGDGSTDDTAAFTAMLASGKKKFHLTDGKNYLISSSLSLTNYMHLVGPGIGCATITCNADVVPIKVLGSYCVVAGFSLVKGPSNTKAGIQNGDASTKCDRTALRDLYISGGSGSLSDGVNPVNGNRGSMVNVHGNSNPGWGCRFSRTVGVNDNHSWHIDPSCNFNGNTAGGFCLEAGTSNADATAPKAHTGGFGTQNNTGRGVYIGTVKNEFQLYSESNGSDDCYLDQYGIGSKLHMVQGLVVGNIAGVAGSTDGCMISYANHNANYRAGYKSKLEVSGGVGKGFRIAGDDGTAGYVEIEKKAARDFRITGSGSGGVWATYFDHSSGTGVQHTVNFGGGVFPMLSASYDIGSSSLVWKDAYVTRLVLGSANRTFSTGSGSPEAVVTASPGAVYLNTGGGAGTTLYIKESGTGNTGWRAV